MEQVLGHLSCCAPYIDDVIMFSSSWQEHVQDLRAVLKALGRKWLTVKEEKFSFCMKYVEYLGHVVVGCGIQAVPEYCSKALSEFNKPHTQKQLTQKQLHSFLSAMSYFRKFLPGYAKLSSVLSPAASVNAPRVVQWTRDMLQAFHKIKGMLCQLTDLCIPTSDGIFILYTDASACGAGALFVVGRVRSTQCHSLVST